MAADPPGAHCAEDRTAELDSTPLLRGICASPAPAAFTAACHGRAKGPKVTAGDTSAPSPRSARGSSSALARQRTSASDDQPKRQLAGPVASGHRHDVGGCELEHRAPTAMRHFQHSRPIARRRCSLRERHTAISVRADSRNAGAGRCSGSSTSPRRGHVRAAARSCRPTPIAGDDAGIPRRSPAAQQGPALPGRSAEGRGDHRRDARRRRRRRTAAGCAA